MSIATQSTGSHHTFEDLGEGITFGRARPDGVALSNTGLIDLGESTLVFDTSLTIQGGRAICAASQDRTGRFPTLAANSHWHLDHIMGNQVFADGPIYATKKTVEILLQKRAELEGELTQEKLETEIREFERQQKSAASEKGRAEYDLVLRINHALLAEVMELRLTPPNSTFDGELKLPGDSGACLISFGAGHTESDAILHLPKSRLIFAGDLIISGSHPNLSSGDPQHWLTVLDRIEGLKPERIGTGHGPLGGVETIAEMRDYLSTIVTLAQEPGTPEMPSRFRNLTEPSQFSSNVEYARSKVANARS
jgi:cyclase